jgi:MoxR-like ATPase
MANNHQYLTYGAKVSAQIVTRLLDHALDTMLAAEPTDDRPTPVCIWGLHGIGKTELVREVAQQRGCQLVYLAPAQFEEMGDLIGMPRIVGDVTAFAPPAWVPTTKGPGILLLDDVNRADDRILRGIMQLLQYSTLVSWQLPAHWLIVLTANPDGGDYSVTPLDDAMLNRMLHITMEFDLRAWARWAESAGVDPRGINFVITYPELVSGKRTTPRSLVQFFNSIRHIDDLREELPLIKILGDACLDEATTQAFINFVHLRLDLLPTPAQILEADDFAVIADRLSRLVISDGGAARRLDILNVVVTRLSNYLLLRKADLSDAELNNLRQFLLLDLIPNDLRLAMAQELTNSKRPGLMRLYAIPEIGALLLNKM